MIVMFENSKIIFDLTKLIKVIYSSTNGKIRLFGLRFHDNQ